MFEKEFGKEFEKVFPISNNELQARGYSVTSTVRQKDLSFDLSSNLFLLEIINKVNDMLALIGG